MLLRFVVENLFCFAEETVFSMVASEDVAHPEQVIVSGRSRALRISALYGANAHGKSKLVEAMALAQRLIIHGRRPGQSIPVKPFCLDSKRRNQPSRFEFTILVKGIEYTYGFVVDSKKVCEEWLFYRPNNAEIRLFERVTDDHLKTEITIGGSLAKKGSQDRAFIELIKRGVRENQLFLSEAVERNIKKLDPVYNWFLNTLTILAPEQPVSAVSMLARNNREFYEFISHYLKLVDTGISGIDVKEDKVDVDILFSDVPVEIRRDMEKNLENGHVLSFSGQENLTVYSGEEGPSRLQLMTQHIDMDGNSINFSLRDESSGTCRLIQMLPLLFDLGVDDNVYIVDELDRTLHPTLSRMFVETFLKNGKKNKSQMIFTTHETSLLDSELLRRDEIWFVEKDQMGKTHLYSLYAFKERSDLNIERGYLQGRFGAIPFMGDTSTLGW